MILQSLKTLISVLFCLILIEQIQGEKILRTCIRNAYSSLRDKIQKLTDLDEKNKSALIKSVAEKLSEITDQEERALTVKFIRRRVQFTNITDGISLNRRIFTQMDSVIRNFSGLGEKIGNRDAAAAVFTIEMLLKELFEDCKQGQGSCFTPIGQDAVCDPSLCSDRYRRIDGVCNNLDSKHWGAIGIPMRRFTAMAYKCKKV